jgi:hypothetical protein
MLIAKEKYKGGYIVYIDESERDVWADFRPRYLGERLAY